MRSDIVVVVTSWIAITVIAVAYMWIAGINFWSNLMLLVLLGIASILTFGVMFASPTGFLDVGASKKILNELYRIGKELDEVKSIVEEIRNTLEE